VVVAAEQIETSRLTVISFEHESATNSAYGDDGP